MPRSRGKERQASPLAALPWVTEDGALDPAKFPIEGLLRQSLDQGLDRFRAGCSMLRLLCSVGRAEAGVYLLGLLRFYQADLERLAVVVESLAGFRTPESAEALFNELRRVKSDNSTRRYLDVVLRVLSGFPRQHIEVGLRVLADDDSFSYKMRRKFRDVLEQVYCQSAAGV